MPRLFFLFIVVALAPVFVMAQSLSSRAAESSCKLLYDHQALHGSTTAAPLFIENKGQWDKDARYLARLGGMNVWITDKGLVYDVHTNHENSNRSASVPTVLADTPPLQGHIVKMNFAGSKQTSHARGIEKQTPYFNYFIGNDRSKWASNVPSYAEVRLDNLYDGISARVYFDGAQVRYDMILAPGADASQIALEFDGADDVRVNNTGDLVLQTSVGELLHGKLYAYQMKNGRREQIPCRFTTKSIHNSQPKTQNFSFALGAYDPTLPLVIDPLVWGTYIGGSASDLAQSATMDANGDIYIVGASASANFPTSAGAYDAMPTGLNDAIITKLKSDGSSLEFSTFLGGNGTESESRICLDNSGNVYAVGLTTSTNFPMESAYDGTFNGGGEDFYIAKLISDGTDLDYSTYFGGSDAEDYTAQPFVDAAGMIYFGGRTYSNNYPTTGGAYRTMYVSDYDGVITKLNPSLGASGLVYSTYIGTAGLDHVSSIVVPPSSNLIYFGGTLSGGGLATANAFDQTYNGGWDICIGILNPLGGGTSDMQYLSYVGGSGFEANALARYDVQTRLFYLVTGSNSVNFPTTANAFQTACIGSEDAAIAVINPAVVGAAALVYGTYIGGSGGTNQQAQYVVRGRDGRLYIVGYTDSPSFPTTPRAMQLQKRENGDIFVSVINPTRSGAASLEYSTFIGTAANDLPVQAAFTDAAGNIIVVNSSTLAGFPVSANVHDPTFNGGTADIAVFKLQPTPEFPLRTGFGSYLRFGGNAARQSLRVPSSPLTDFGAQDFTIECLFNSSNPPPPGDGASALLTSRWNQGGNASRWWTLGFAANAPNRGKLFFEINGRNGGGINQNINSSKDFTDGAWHHVAVVRNRTIITMYIDGVADASMIIPPETDLSGNGLQSGPITFGAFGPSLSSSQFFYTGLLDEVRLWKVALSPEIINRQRGVELPERADMQNGPQGRANLFGYWKFNDYDGLTTPDGSPSRLDAVMVNMFGDAVESANQNNTVFTSPRTPSAYTPSILRSIGQLSSSFPVNVLLNGTNGGAALATVSVSGQSLQYTPLSPNFVPQGFTDRVNYRLAQERDTVSGSILVRFTPEMMGSTVYGLPNTTTPMQPSAYTVFGGTTPFSYAWSPTVGLSSTTASLPSFTLATNAVYSLTITDALGFTATTTVSINVNGPFYYISGDAAERSSWNADPAGTAVAPLSMAIPAEFIVRPAKTAQLQSSLTVVSGGMLTVETGATLAIAGGVILQNQGTVQIGGALTLQDNASVTTAPIRWLGERALLTYVGTQPTIASTVEFPSLMTTASVVIDNSGGVRLGGSKSITTAFSLRANALCNTNAATLRLAGDVALSGRFADDAAGTVNIEGSGTIIGTLNIASPSLPTLGTIGRLRSITLNRSGARLALGTPVALTGSIILTNGTVIASSNNFLRLTAIGTDAVVGGSRQSFVEGAVQRVLPPNSSPSNTQEYLFPTGQGSAYLPFSLIAPASGSEGAIVQAQAFNAQVSGSVGENISLLTGVGYWETRLVSGALAHVQIGLRPTSPLTALSSVARSDSPAGVFVGVGAATVSTTTIVSLPLTQSSFLNGVFALGANAPPTISSFTPESGTTGTVVSITGTNFTTSATVTFGGVTAASVRVISSAELQAVVADGATGSVQVATVYGSVESQQRFTYLLPPTITDFAPSSAGAGGRVVIQGTNFSTPAEVFFGGVSASSVSVETAGQITATVSAGGTSGALTVRTRSGSATAPQEFSFEGAPTITGFVERAVTTGASLSIRGTNLLKTRDVRVGGIAAEILDTTAKQLRVRVPAGIVSSPASVSLATPFGETTSSVLIPITERAALISFSPAVGFAGTPVVLSGAGFLGATTVTIAGVSALFTIDSDSRISAVAGAVRSRGKVVVQGSTGRAESANDFAPPAPVLTSFVPRAATSGTAVILTGMNFQIVTSVTLGGVNTSRFTIDSPSQITVIAPQRERGSGIVSVQSEGGISTSTLLTDSFFTFVPTQATVRSPRIMDFTPKVGSKGTTITVSGANLDSSLVGYVGGVLAARVVSLSPNQVVLTLGAGASGLVQVLTVNGVATSSARLTYYTPLQVDSLTLREAARVWAERTNNASNAHIDWLSTIPMERWRGTTIEQGRVTGIAVTGATLVGALPDTLRQLTSLKTLILNSCFIEGTLPSFLEDWKALERLDLSNNALSGSIPPSVLLLPQMRSINLSRNRFAGRLELGSTTQTTKRLTQGARTQADATALEELDLSSNALEGAIPPQMSLFPLLRRLVLADNRFSGSLPASLASLNLLEEVNVAGNRLEGLTDMSALKRLTKFAVEHNKLDFAALEPNAGVRGISYAPQDSLGEAGIVKNVPLESRFTLNPRLAGRRVSYQWLKNGEEVRSASLDSLLVFPFVRSSDAGNYVCRAVSNSFPGLALTTVSITLSTAPPLAPTDIVRLVFPLNESINISTLATVRWAAIPPTAEGNVRTVSYETHIALDTSFASLVAETTTASAEVSIRGLEPLRTYYWRVRAVNGGGVGAWSSVWRFTTASGTAEIALSFAAFPRTVLGESSTQPIVLTNQTKVSLTLEDVTLTNNAETNYTLPEPLQNRVLQSGESLEVLVAFAPRTVNRLGESKEAGLHVRFRASGLPASQTTSATLTGKAGVLFIQTALPDTVAVGRRIVGALNVINRWQKTITLETAKSPSDAVFGFAESTRRQVGVNDTAVVAYSCLALREGDISGGLVLKGYEETQAGVSDEAVISLNTIARLPTTDDIVVRFGARPSADNLPPGTLVTVSVVLDSGNVEKLVTSAESEWRAIVSFDRNVLVPIEGQSGVRTLRRSDSTGRETQIEVTGRFANLKRELATMQCRVVAGDTVRTRLRLESMNVLSNVVGRQVFVEPSRDTVFTASVSRAGGVRLIAPTKGMTLSVNPNPAREAVEVAYTLAEAVSPEISLSDATGKTLQSLGFPLQEAGSYTISLNLNGLASGVYTVLLRGGTGVVSQKIIVAR